MNRSYQSSFNYDAVGPATGASFDTEPIEPTSALCQPLYGCWFGPEICTARAWNQNRLAQISVQYLDGSALMEWRSERRAEIGL